jgi:endonuclease YncB( thermonuclease family)
MPVPIIAIAMTFACTPVAVYDGDGPIWCAEGPHVRVAGVAAREMDGGCRRNQPCPDASALAARDAMVGLLGRRTGVMATGHIRIVGPTMQCVSNGPAGGNRTAAWCTLADGRDLSCAAIATGTMLRWDRYWRGRANC